MKRIAKWFLLLNKRLYKKATFLIILALVLLAVILLQVAARQESGFVRVALAQQDRNDSISSEIVNDLLSSSKLILYTDCATPDEAIAMVKSGKADAAWIFSADMQQKIDQYVQPGSNRDPVVAVIEREESVPLRLTQERLSATLYRYCSSSMYISYVRKNIEQLDAVSDEQLLFYYDAFNVDGNLFAFSYPDEAQSTEDAQDTGYLLAPLRGLLSVLVVLCGLAAAMFYMQDEAAGTFSWVPLQYKPLAAFGSQIIAVLNIAVVMLISLYFVGVATSFVRECLLLLLFAISCTLFCMVLQQLFNSIRVFGSLIPLLVILMIGICPVFFDLKPTKTLQLLFPPTYYINAVHNSTYLWYMLLYIFVLAVLYITVRKLLKRQS